MVRRARSESREASVKILLSAVSWGARLHVGGGCHPHFGSREVGRNGGAHPRAALQGNRASKLFLNDSVDHRKPETGAFAGALRREEGVEDALLGVGVHSMPCVGYRERHHRLGARTRLPLALQVFERKRG